MPQLTSILVFLGCVVPLQDEAQVAELCQRAVSMEITPDELSAGLIALGPAAIDELFELVVGRAVPAEWIPDGAPLALSPELVTVVDEALASAPPAELRAFLVELDQSERWISRRTHAVELLGRFGTALDVGLMLRLGAPHVLDVERRVLPRAHRKSLAAALGAVIERDDVARGALAALLGKSPPIMQSTLVDALAEPASPEALESLADVLDRSGPLQPYVLSAITTCARRLRAPFDDAVRRRVQGHLRSVNPATARSAVRAAGVLEDYEALPELVDHHESGDASMRSAAHAALRELTGLGLPDDPAAWRRWYERERTFAEVERPTLVRDVLVGSVDEAARALRRLAGRRYRRHELALSLAGALERPEPRVVRLTCNALETLASPVVEEDLQGVLLHPDPTVSEAARTALAAIDPPRGRLERP